MARPKSNKEEAKIPKSDGTATKAKKDSGAPKRPISAYLIYMNENRQRIKDEHPKAKPTEVVKIGAKEWNELQDKTKYEKLAKAMKADYEKKLAEHQKPGDN